jgi:site-specific recombinase XerD
VRRSLTGFVGGLLEDGAALATARARQLAVRRFSAWLTEEGEIPADPFFGAKAPKLDAKVVKPLTEVELKAMLKTCAGVNLFHREGSLRADAEAAEATTTSPDTPGRTVAEVGGAGRTSFLLGSSASPT